MNNDWASTMIQNFIKVLLLYIVFVACSKMEIRRLGQRVVNTKLGKYRGVLNEFTGDSRLRDIEAFYGVRYASLRNGLIRFMPPSSNYYKWNSVRTVSKVGKVCPQIRQRHDDRREKALNVTFSDLISDYNAFENQTEDCLTLNLFVPMEGMCKSVRVN